MLILTAAEFQIRLNGAGHLGAATHLQATHLLATTSRRLATISRRLAATTSHMVRFSYGKNRHTEACARAQLLAGNITLA